MLTAKENLMHLYLHQKIDVMPAPGEGEQGVFPINGFLERPAYNRGGRDWFGCKWDFMEAAGAPAPDTREHILDDICDWREVVKFPDLDAWDWKKAKEVDHVAEIDRENNVVNVIVCNGLFERLHVLMGFENALCALLTDPEEVGAFFDAMTEYKIKLIGKLKEHYNPDVITFHDDWGTQRAMFFSPELWRTLIKPRTAKIIDFAHSCGMGFIMHSCGKMDEIIKEICEIGVDTLQIMDINDIGAALRKTDGHMTIQASVHTQEFEAKDKAGLLTPEIVRDTVHREFMSWGASGRYFPFILPPSNWYEKVVLEEYMSCREALHGAYQA